MLEKGSNQHHERQGSPDRLLSDRLRLCDATVERSREVEQMSLLLLDTLHGSEFVQKHVAGVDIIDSPHNEVIPLAVDGDPGRYRYLISRSLGEKVSDMAELAAALAHTGCYIQRVASTDSHEHSRIQRYAATIDSVKLLSEAGFDPGAVSTFWDKVSSSNDSFESTLDYLQGVDPRDMARIASDTFVALADRQELPVARPELPHWLHQLQEFQHASSTDHWFASRSFQSASVEEQFDLLAQFYERELAGLDEEAMDSLRDTRLKDYCTYVARTMKRYDVELQQSGEGVYTMIDRFRLANEASNNEGIGYVFSRVLDSMSDFGSPCYGKEELLFQEVASFSSAESYEEIREASERIVALLQDDAVRRGLEPFAHPEYAIRRQQAMYEAVRFPSIAACKDLQEGEALQHSLHHHVTLAVEHQSPELTSVLLRLGLEVDPRVQQLQEDLGLSDARLLRSDTDRPAGARARDFVFNQAGQIVGMRENPATYEASAKRLYRCSQKGRIDTPEEREERIAYDHTYSSTVLEAGTRAIDTVDWNMLKHDSAEFIERYKSFLMIPRVPGASEHPFAKRFCEECSALMASGDSTIRETLRSFFSNGSHKTLRHLVQYPGVLEEQNRYDSDRLKDAIDVVRKPHSALSMLGREYYIGDKTRYVQLVEIGLHHLTVAQQLDDTVSSHTLDSGHPYIQLILEEELFSTEEKQQFLSQSLDGFTSHKQRPKNPDEVQRFDYRKLGYGIPESADEMGRFIGVDTSKEKALARYELTRFLIEKRAELSPELLVCASDLATEFRSNYFGEPEDVSPFNYRLRELVTEAIAREKEALLQEDRPLQATLESYLILKEHGLLKHEEQKVLEKTLESWIARVSPDEQKAACETLLFARSIEKFPSSAKGEAVFSLSYSGFIDDPEFRSEILNRYLSLLCDELQVDDGTEAYRDATTPRIEELLENLSDSTAYELMNRLAPVIEAQRGLCAVIRDHFQTSDYAVLETDNLSLLFGKGVLSHLTHSDKTIQETLTFLREPLSDTSLEQYYQTTFRSYFGALSQFSPAASAYLLRSLNMSRIDEVKGKLESFHKNFWRMTPEAQVVFIDKIVLPVSLQPEERDQKIRDNISSGLDRALTSDMEHRAIAHEMATVFLEELDADSCRLMTAMAFVSHNPYESEKRLGEVLSRVLGVGLDVAGDKLLQGIHSAAEVPQDVKDDVSASKMNASPVPRWELVHWIDTRGPGMAVDRIGKVLGSGASAVTIQGYDTEGTFALKVLRPEVAYRGERHFGRAEKAAERLHTVHRRYRMLPDIVKESRRSFSIEVKTEYLERQLANAHQCYDDVDIRLNNTSYRFPVADLRAPGTAPAVGEEYSCFYLAEGEHFNDLVERSAEAIESHAMAHATIELYNRLRGIAVCTDRHGGQQKVEEGDSVQSIQLDVAAFQLDDPSNEMLKSFGEVINATVVRALRNRISGSFFAFFGATRDNSMNNFAKIFSEQSDRIAAGKSLEVKQYLDGIKRSFLANGDFFNQLSLDQVSSCIKAVYDTGEIHPQIHSQFGFFSRRWLQGMQSQESSVSLSIQSSSEVIDT